MIASAWRPFAIGLAGLWLTRKKFMLPSICGSGRRSAERVLFKNKALGPKLTKLLLARGDLDPGLPSDRQLLGWIFTEMGRQPWVVYGLFQTRDASPPASPGRGPHLDDRLRLALRHPRRHRGQACS